jgi:hypothetical protein
MRGSLSPLEMSGYFCHDLSSQFRCLRLPIDLFLTPLIIKGDEEARTQFLNTSTHSSGLSGPILSGIQTLYLAEDLCCGQFWPGF